MFRISLLAGDFSQSQTNQNIRLFLPRSNDLNPYLSQNMSLGFGSRNRSQCYLLFGRDFRLSLKKGRSSMNELSKDRSEIKGDKTVEQNPAKVGYAAKVPPEAA